MPKFDIRFVQMVPVWAYAEVEAETIDDTLDLLEESPESFIYEVDSTFDQTPGTEENDLDFAEYRIGSNETWKSV
jgi:hypothetical protein